MKNFDAVIIGSGQGGNPLARKLARAGWKTAIIEKRLIGGTCINDGCTPTKAMVACAQTAYTVANSYKWGVDVMDYKIDLEKIISRKNEIVAAFRSGAEKGLEDTDGLEVIRGEAVFTGPRTLAVTLDNGGTETLSAEKIFINTGTRPKIPPVEGLDQVPYLTNTTLLDVKTLPTHLVVLGGGYVALEFGQMFRRFGCEVTIITVSSQLLPKEDEDVAAAVRKIMEAAGITVHTSAKIVKAEMAGEMLAITADDGKAQFSIAGSHLLVATGRTPQTSTLDPGKAGINMDKKGYITVNEYLETNVPGIYALGDVNGGPAFTHISYHDHLVILKNLLEQEQLSVKSRPLPYCMFTDPQLGRIGLTEKDAREQGYQVKVACLDMDKVARAIETGSTQGFMKAVVDADTGKVLGAAILGPEGGEVMSVLQMAMLGNMTAKQLREMVFAHPLYTESLNNLFMKIED